MPSLGSMSSGYQPQTGVPRMQAQVLPSQMAGTQTRYPPYYGQGSNPSQPMSSEFSYRSGTYPRLDSAEGSQHSSPALPLTGFDRSGLPVYGTGQQTAGGLPHMSAYQGSSSAGHSPMPSNVATFGAHPGMPYGSAPDQTGYSTYQQGQYRGEQAYASSSLGHAPYGTESQVPQHQQYGDMSQAGPNSFDSEGRPVDSQGRPIRYQPPTTRGWG